MTPVANAPPLAVAAPARGAWPWRSPVRARVGALGLRGGTWTRPDGAVDSVQWIDLPARPALDLAALEADYFAWVPAMSAGLVRPEAPALGRPARLAIGLGRAARPAMVRMEAPRLDAWRRLRPIVGGLLAHPGGWLSFEVHARPRATRLAVCLVGFWPRLPLFVYLRTQARLHERSTFAFLRVVARRHDAAALA